MSLGSNDENSIINYYPKHVTMLKTVSDYIFIKLIVLGFNDTSTLVGHFVSSPREREKRDRRNSRGDERDGHGRKRQGMKRKKQKK